MWQELKGHFSSAASLKYHTPDIQHIPPSHIILTMSQSVPIPNSTLLMLSAKQKSS